MEIESIYREANALLEGHFILSSGKHSKFYLQSAKVLENPKLAEYLANRLANTIKIVQLKLIQYVHLHWVEYWPGYEIG